MSDISINIDHLTRVEGHGSIRLDASNGSVKEVEWSVTEAPRFFEPLLVGRPFTQAHMITSRICGICSIAHALASLKATEAAMDVELPEEVVSLRRLALHAENMQSHLLHVGYLVLPDLMGVDSVIDLVKEEPDLVKSVISLHRLANEASDMVCGRTTHPMNLVLGGFRKAPSEVALDHLRDLLVLQLESIEKVMDAMVVALETLPDFKRETEYIALVSDDRYEFYDGLIGSSDTGSHPLMDYSLVANEFVVPYSTAKFTKHDRDSYMVGALARFNLSSELLSSSARRWASELGLSAPCHNPFMINAAQLVEIIHSVEDSIEIIDDIQGSVRSDATRRRIRPKAGHGIGAVEAPRGLLVHDFSYDDSGRCIRANCVIPTNQNHNNINMDLKALAPTLLDRPRDEIEHALEMLVRAYDPCISCSTHLLTVRWDDGGKEPRREKNGRSNGVCKPGRGLPERGGPDLPGR